MVDVLEGTNVSPLFVAPLCQSLTAWVTSITMKVFALLGATETREHRLWRGIAGYWWWSTCAVQLEDIDRAGGAEAHAAARTSRFSPAAIVRGGPPRALGRGLAAQLPALARGIAPPSTNVLTRGVANDSMRA